MLCTMIILLIALPATPPSAGLPSTPSSVAAGRWDLTAASDDAATEMVCRPAWVTDQDDDLVLHLAATVGVMARRRIEDRRDREDRQTWLTRARPWVWAVSVAAAFVLGVWVGSQVGD